MIWPLHGCESNKFEGASCELNLKKWFLYAGTFYSRCEPDLKVCLAQLISLPCTLNFSLIPAAKYACNNKRKQYVYCLVKQI